jgi:zinc transporter ZupT
MKIILQIHAAVEIIAGFVLLFNPELLLSSNSPNIQGLVVAKLYGIAAFFMGIISYLISKTFEYNQTYKKIVLSVIGFHLCIAFYMYGVYQQNLTPHLGAFGTHIAMAVGSLFLYLRDFQKFES